MDSNPLRNWATAFLLLGAVLLVVSLAFAAAQTLLSSVTDRLYGFARTAVPGIAASAVLLAVGGTLWRVGTRRREQEA